MKRGKLLFSSCSCPYDFGPICKHEVAVYYELREPGKLTVQKKTSKPTLHSILPSLEKEELISIIKEFAANDSTLTNKLLLRYSKGTDEEAIKQCKRAIRSIVQRYKGRQGFIEYNQTYSFAVKSTIF